MFVCLQCSNDAGGREGRRAEGREGGMDGRRERGREAGSWFSLRSVGVVLLGMYSRGRKKDSV